MLSTEELVKKIKEANSYAQLVDSLTEKEPLTPLEEWVSRGVLNLPYETSEGRIHMVADVLPTASASKHHGGLSLDTTNGYVVESESGFVICLLYSYGHFVQDRLRGTNKPAEPIIKQWAKEIQGALAALSIRKAALKKS